MDYCGCLEGASLEIVTMADSNLDIHSEVIAIRTCLDCGRKWTGTINFLEADSDYHEEDPCGLKCAFDEGSIEEVGDGTIVGYCENCGLDWWHAFDTKWEPIE